MTNEDSYEDLNLGLLVVEALVLAVLVVQGVEDSAHLLPEGLAAIPWQLSGKGRQLLGVDILAEVQILEGFLELDLSLPILVESVFLYSGPGVGDEHVLMAPSFALGGALGLLDVHHPDLVPFESGSLSLLASEVSFLLEEGQSSALLGA